MTLADLVARWRADAETLETYADTRGATMARVHADQLEAALRDNADELLDLQQAAQESGYSPDRLRHMVADGTIAQAGRKGAPRVRRGDLPSKRRSGSTFDPAAIVAGIHTNH